LAISNVDLAYEPGERCNSNSPIKVQVSQVKKEGDSMHLGFPLAARLLVGGGERRRQRWVER